LVGLEDSKYRKWVRGIPAHGQTRANGSTIRPSDLVRIIDKPTIRGCFFRLPKPIADCSIADRQPQHAKKNQD
jgi:hypothetical protein